MREGVCVLEYGYGAMGIGILSIHYTTTHTHPTTFTHLPDAREHDSPKGWGCARAEVDLYVPPKLVIEVGFRDDFLMKKWDSFEEKGFDFLYFQNVEIHDPDLLERCVGKVMASIHEVNDSAHDEEEEVDPPVLKLPAEGNPDLKHLMTHEKKQFKRLRSDLNRCKQILKNEIENLESTPDREEEKVEIRAHRDVIELMDKLLSHISHKHPER